MTPEFTLNVDDCFIPEGFVPRSLRRRAGKARVPFPGTANLMTYFKHLITMNEDEGKKMVAEFYRFFGIFYEHIEKGPDSYEKGMWMLSMLDQILAQAARHYPNQYGRVSCQPSCNHCCHQRLTVTKLEASVLLSHVKRLGIKLDRQRAKQQEKKALEAYNDLPYEDQGCLMLDENGNCRVYEYRPLSCRKYNVVSPPEMCDKRAHSHAQILFDIHAEALTGAAFAYDSPSIGLDRAMADQLLRNIPESSNLWSKDEKTDRTRN